MRKLVPLKNSVICRRIVEGSPVIKSDIGLVYRGHDVDIYELESVAADNDKDFTFKSGDHVIVCSTGDELEVNPGDIHYMFKVDNVMCKVED